MTREYIFQLVGINLHGICIYIIHIQNSSYSHIAKLMPKSRKDEFKKYLSTFMPEPCIWARDSPSPQLMLEHLKQTLNKYLSNGWMGE